MRRAPGIGRVTLVLMLVAAFQPAAQAGVEPWGEAAVQIYFCDRDASAHPGRVTMRQIVTTDMLEGHEELELIMQYSFGAATSNATIPTGKTIRGRVRVFKADGSKIDLGVMEARVTPDGAAAAAKLVDLSLAKGDVVRWRFTFRAFPAMNPFDTFLLIGATSRPGPDY